MLFHLFRNTVPLASFSPFNAQPEYHFLTDSMSDLPVCICSPAHCISPLEHIPKVQNQSIFKMLFFVPLPQLDSKLHEDSDSQGVFLFVFVCLFLPDLLP